MNLRQKKIVVTGGGGFLGSWVVKELKKQGAKNISVPRSRNFDLRDPEVCKKLVTGQDILVHIAAYVGGIALNKARPGKMFYDNAVMGIHLLEEARRAGVEKILIIGTACSYPKYCAVPFREEDLWGGYPDEVTGVYGLAKKMLLVQAQAYRQEYGLNCIYLIPVNLYGPRDNFDPEFGHVIPALLQKFVEAKKKRLKKVIVWGSGTATREFLYVEDAATAIISALEKYDGKEPVNVGTGQEISIKDLVREIKYLVGFKGKIVWDVSRPDGQPRRMVDTTRAKEGFGFIAHTTLKEGLKKTLDWYLKTQSTKSKIQNKLKY